MSKAPAPVRRWTHPLPGEDWAALGIAFAASAVTAFVAVKWLLRYIQSNRFTAFAIYRFALGALLLAFL